jgi:pilus assembly protein CpaF
MSDHAYIVIETPNHPAKSFKTPYGVYTVGADAGNRICLSADGVSRKHAILTIMEDESYVEDLVSDTGVIVNGQPVENRQRIHPGDTLRIGPYTLRYLDHDPETNAPPPPPPPKEKPREQAPASGPPPGVQRKNALTASSRDHHELTAERAIKRQLQNELLERLDLKRLTIHQVQENELRDRVKSALESMIREISGKLPPHLPPDRLAKELYDEAVGLGPLEDLLQDNDITEIMVNGPGKVYVERAGKIHLTDKTFIDDSSVLAVIERIVSPIGRRIDESSPYVDARLPDGSRVNAIIPPLSLIGPCLTIRLFSKEPFFDTDLCRFGTVTPEICSFIRVAVQCRKNIIISGGTGSGKTTMLNVVSNYLPGTERIVTIEDSAELRLPQEHVVRLESRPPNIEGRGAVTIRDLVRNALRMRPDRIVVGECRGGEALDMLQAMNTGHEGSLTTIHANSPRDALSRLETMMLMAGMDLPLRAIREQIGAAIHLIVHLSRFSDGTRKVSRVTEVVGMEGDKITTQDLFEYNQTGIGENGRVRGAFRPTGAVPTFLEEIRVRGIEFDHNVFDEKTWPAS